MNRIVQLICGVALMVIGGALLYADGLWVDENAADGGDPTRLALWLWPLMGVVVTVTGALRPSGNQRRTTPTKASELTATSLDQAGSASPLAPEASRPSPMEHLR